MKRSSYRERDYAFGQTFLTLRTSIGLTQADLARRLRISRKAVGEWEAGKTYPTAEHLKAVDCPCRRATGLAFRARGSGDSRLLASGSPEGAAR